MEIYKNYSKQWNEILIKYGDPRTTHWAMMEGFAPTILICISYVILVKKIGPYLMESRKPFQLRGILIVYNSAMVVLSTYLFYEFLASGWWNDYSFVCQPVVKGYSPKALRMTHTCWVFFISKFIELLDTIFFVMRKKNNQVSFLHVFHHTTMPLNWWVAVKFVPGGHGSFHALFNSFIHILMYFYYAIAALGPKYKKYLFWKKHMTSLQMVQFFIVLIHAAQLWFIRCDYPRIFVIWIMVAAGLFIGFFGNFYINEYYKRRPLRSASSQPKTQPIAVNDEKKDD